MPRVRRIVGVDTARGLAVLGMVTAHVGLADPERTFPPGGWAQLADGRPSALFVLLAGVGLALLSGGSTPVVGTRLVQARLRILVRAVLLVVLGTGLVLLETPVVVILVVYAALFAAGTAVLRWPRWALVVAATVVALLGPVLRQQLAGHVEVDDARPLDLLTVLLGEYYPAIVWIAYVLVGLAVGRSDLRAGRTHAALAAWGAGLVVLGHGGAWAARLLLGRVTELTTAEPHSSTFFEVTGNTGTCLLVLAVCLAVGVRWPRALAPVSATGALALTAYTGQLLAIAVLGDDVVWQATATSWLAFLLVTVGFCWLWHATVGRGPLETLLHAVSVRAADVAPDTLPPRPEPGDGPAPARAHDDPRTDPVDDPAR
ncbi:heparan-alpha-glucosaminide N-acetyltransferase domain-containing protein [Cellulomonas xiejunii]|uniref:heparan-alpha-glucosaminide N-acetyltransferase domain-containing protein n=1 Tax=Cellulomonas xiejunii TaxID=2968083 RepID=UPI001D0ED193|nr:heparan-alpha-glucosaminide N-acetyltransferase domain-containing protein [Cellulomonas xiejunii]MCC2315168.1 heparan-alpha-glucosaminide N-acetyltransferase domain-containing protein [Cellulomonas xiejunii]